jgi:hypothetical protein
VSLSKMLEMAFSLSELKIAKNHINVIKYIDMLN